MFSSRSEDLNCSSCFFNKWHGLIALLGLCDSGEKAEGLVLAIFCWHGTGRAILGATEGGFAIIEPQPALDWKSTFGLGGGKGRRSARLQGVVSDGGGATVVSEDKHQGCALTVKKGANRLPQLIERTALVWFEWTTVGGVCGDWAIDTESYRRGMSGKNGTNCRKVRSM